MKRDQFSALIRETLAEHPDWLHDALFACAAGPQDAMQRLRDERTRADAAMLAALGLAQSKRHSKEHILNVEAVVARAINAEHPCEAEREFLKAHKGGET